MINSYSSKILIVDDQEKNIQVLANILSDEGYQIEFANNGLEAIEWLSEERFDLVLLDVMMPELNGYDTCKRIKKGNLNYNTPIVFLTAKTESEDVLEGFKAGGVDYIAKPFNSEELLVRVKTHIELQKSKEELARLYGKTQESIRYARNIQKAVVSSEAQLNNIFKESFLLHSQKDIVGGDFFWIKEKEGKIFLAVGDCSGHGVPGAMMSMLGVSLLNKVLYASHLKEASEIMDYLKSELLYNISDNEAEIHDSIDMGFCVINPYTGELQHSNANFQMIIVSDKPKLKNVDSLERSIKYLQEDYNNKSFEFFKQAGSTIGHNKTDFKQINLEFKLEPNDKIYLFSDGITDQLGGERNRKLTRRGIFKIIKKYGQLSILEQKNRIKEEFVLWKGENEQIDDIILLGFSINK